MVEIVRLPSLLSINAALPLCLIIILSAAPKFAGTLSPKLRFTIALSSPPALISPPANTLPATPTPPSTSSAPVLLLVDSVVLVM